MTDYILVKRETLQAAADVLYPPKHTELSLSERAYIAFANLQALLAGPNVVLALIAERDHYKALYEDAHEMRADAALEAMNLEEERDALAAELEEWRFTNRVDELQREHDKLAAKVKQMEAQEPVAEICSDFTLCWVGSGPIAPIVEKHKLKVGHMLYASPGANPDAKDAARYRWLRSRPLGWSVEHHHNGWTTSYGCDDLDAAINAAIEGAKE